MKDSHGLMWAGVATLTWFVMWQRDVALDAMTRQLGSGSKVEGSPEPSHDFKPGVLHPQSVHSIGGRANTAPIFSVSRCIAEANTYEQHRRSKERPGEQVYVSRAQTGATRTLCVHSGQGKGTGVLPGGEHPAEQGAVTSVDQPRRNGVLGKRGNRTSLNSPARQSEPSVAGLSVRPVARRTISVYGFPGDGSGPASGFIAAVPYKGKKSKGRWEWKRGTKLRLTNGKRSVVVRVADVCNGRYWGRRVDLPKEPYLALGGAREWGLIHDVKVEVVK